MGGVSLSILEQIPLLAGLPRVELAKLLADLEELVLRPGERLSPTEGPEPALYFVVEGEVEVLRVEGAREVSLMLLGPGGFVGEEALFQQTAGTEWIQATTQTRLGRLPCYRVERLLAGDPALSQAFLRMMAAKHGGAASELARTKRILAAYSDALWKQVPEADPFDGAPTPSEPVPAAAASAAPSVPAHAQPAKRSRPLGLRAALTGCSLLLAVFTYWVNRGDPVLAGVTATLAWATASWLFNTAPDYAVGLAASAALVLLKVTGAAIAFGGFASPSWFLLLGAGGIGVAVSRSGLLYRIALHMLRLLPPTYLGQSLAMALTGILFTPLLPSANSRVAMASPLARELGEAMRFPDRSRGATGLAMSTFLGFGLMYFLYLNGANTSLLAWSLMPEPIQREINWVAWLWMALPIGLLFFVGCYGALLWLYRPEATARVSPATIQAQLQVLGPMNRMERITSRVLGLTLVGFITQGLHGIDASWLALAGFLILLAAGIIDKAGLKAIDWNFLLLFGTLVSLSQVIKVTGLSDLLSTWVGPVLAPLGASPYLFLGAVALLTLIVRLVIPLQPTVLIMIIALLPISVQMGYHPFCTTVIVLALSNNWLVPQQNSVYLGVYSATDERSFTHEQARPFAIAHALVGLVAVLLCVPIWQVQGLLPW